MDPTTHFVPTGRSWDQPVTAGLLVDLLDDDMPAQRALARARTGGIRIFDPTSVVVVAPVDRGINAGATMTGPANDVAIAI